MSALTGDFTNQTVLIYDTNGNHLISTHVVDYDKVVKQLTVHTIPEELKLNDTCKLLILSAPTPCEFGGKIKGTLHNPYIALFQGQTKENRDAARYLVTTPAIIPAYIIDSIVHPIQNPIKVVLINISTSGVRFRAPFYSFEIGDEFQMHFVINNNQKAMIAHVVNVKDNEPISSDYGCRFITM